MSIFDRSSRKASQGAVDMFGEPIRQAEVAAASTNTRTSAPPTPSSVEGQPHFASAVQSAAQAAEEAAALPLPETLDAEAMQRFKGLLQRIYFQMGLGLGVTALSAILFYIFFPHFLFRATTFMVLGIAQLGLCLVFSRSVRHMRAARARTLFYAYSFLSGLTVAFLALYFHLSTLAVSFGISALLFFILSVIGYRSKKDFSQIGRFGYALLWGVILVSLGNLLFYYFFPGVASILDLAINYLVVAIFIGLILYETQVFKRMAYQTGYLSAREGDSPAQLELEKTLVIHGAFQLYLDFLNLFIRFTYILGSRD